MWRKSRRQTDDDAGEAVQHGRLHNTGNAIASARQAGRIEAAVGNLLENALRHGHRRPPRPRRASSARMSDVDEVQVVVAHAERVTLRAGDVFLKVDADQARIDVEVAAMAM